ncbi:SDR family oxidoreductase [Rhabdobacter roseus]|uniref:NAD(P)-dependent dehydrogenase (Short-subunit alcohol dehydrogenase family) n=1 Tax=Rhabdobacter roseus TaxID=1655419 RepID=A0A840TK24_9BACT|nr:SDR family oxidoreductase [Rhabdobacter roseus]MBB5283285.1 NAD(P)-dependent dehydrogenase (short-subunit alcohol dehydrogenase family) [Rhabdobacter roseus]
MIREKLDLHGKTALVTGSSQGIGRAIALALAEFGADVIVHHHQSPAEAKEVLAAAKKLGAQGFAVGADLGKKGAARRLFQEVHKKTRQVDILVLNASVQVPALWQDVTDEQTDQQLHVNVKSSLQLMQAFAPPMVERGWGRILTLGSTQQLKPHPAMVVYAATKSAVENMVKNMAMQLANQGVTVNNLAPGVIDTPRIDEPVPEIDERIAQRMSIPEGNPAQPEECAGLALFLCSDAGRYVTGQTIYVDGGMSL